MQKDQHSQQIAKKEVDGEDLTEKINEIPSAVRSRKVAQGLSCSEQRRIPGGVIKILESSGFC
jgi:hypothetical protein